MKHKIKYQYLCDYNSILNTIFGEGELSEKQIELLKKAKPHNLNYYIICLEDKTSFTTYYDKNDFLDITLNKLELWNNV